MSVRFEPGQYFVRDLDAGWVFEATVVSRGRDRVTLLCAENNPYFPPRPYVVDCIVTDRHGVEKVRTDGFVLSADEQTDPKVVRRLILTWRDPRDLTRLA